MNRKILLVLVGIGLLACNFLFPREAVPTPTEKAITQPPTESVPNPTEETTIQSEDSETITLAGFTITRLHPEDGDLQSMLAEESQKATALGQMPVVEFDATWCPPCVAIDAAIDSENELMFKAYAGTYIIKLDVDEWGWNNGRVENFEFDGIPVYFKLDADGTQTSEVIDGGAWGEDIPKNIAPVMDEFFHGG